MHETVLIHIDALLKDYNKKDPRNFLPPVKENIKEFLEVIYNVFPNISIYSDINIMVAQKVLRDNRAMDFVNQIVSFKEDSSVYIDKNSIKFNDSSKASIKFASILNFVVDYLNKRPEYTP